jgi:ATP-dependent RNA/DNA helicase IGHMBP2
MEIGGKEEKKDKKEKPKGEKHDKLKKKSGNVSGVASSNNTKIVGVKSVAFAQRDDKSEEERREEFEKILQKFLTSSKQEHCFSADLNSFERRLVHDIADKLGLIHESSGVGEERFILVKKREGKYKREKEPEVVKVSLDLVECRTCHKEVPRNNIDLQNLELINKDKNKNVDKSVKSKKEKSKKSKKGEVHEEEDFDSMLASFHKKDTVCNYPKCKALTATIGVNCPFCRVRFCLTHSMAEVHGCGPAAKAAARQQISRDGKLYPGSGRPTAASADPGKKAVLQRKLDKKLGDLEEKRKTKNKENKK